MPVFSTRPETTHSEPTFAAFTAVSRYDGRTTSRHPVFATMSNAAGSGGVLAEDGQQVLEHRVIGVVGVGVEDLAAGGEHAVAFHVIEHHPQDPRALLVDHHPVARASAVGLDERALRVGAAAVVIRLLDAPAEVNPATRSLELFDEE